MGVYTDLREDPEEAAKVLRRMRDSAAKILKRYRNAARHLAAPGEGGGIVSRPIMVVLSNFGGAVYANRFDYKVTHFCHNAGCPQPLD